ncbi:MAG: hypothetical protein H6618_09410 [Deltaproteobacteria bacterium]|nr:hypothetical protein [Deltaproteobacteria bacterium]
MTHDKRINIAIIEDEEYYLKGMTKYLSDKNKVNLSLYRSPDDFAVKFNKKGDADYFDYILIDYHFGLFTSGEKQIAGYIRQFLYYRGKLILWTMEDNENVIEIEHYDRCLSKNLFDLCNIVKIME